MMRRSPYSASAGPRSGCAGRLIRGVLAVAGTATLAAVGLAAPAAADGAPSWEVSVKQENGYYVQGQVLDPFTLSAEDFERDSGYNRYLITVTNRGPGAVAAEPAQPVTVTDELPRGLVLAYTKGEEFQAGGWSCEVQGVQEGEVSAGGRIAPRRFTCVRESNHSELASGHSYQPIEPDVYVEGAAPSSLTDTATVSGGEASPANASGSAQTNIVEAVPFGIYQFEVGDLASEGAGSLEHENATPDTQAGGHPFAFSTKLAFNFTTLDSGLLGPAGGPQEEFAAEPQKVEVQLPPGLVGDPLNSARCTIEQVQLRVCSQQNSAVGYINFTDTAGEIEEGRLKPYANGEQTLVYNIQPPRGYPAAFAFLATAQHVLVVLDASLQAAPGVPGGYRVSTGVAASASLRNARITFCGTGAEQRQEGESEAHCRPPATGSKPFLTNPTQCTQAPTALFETDPYATGPSSDEEVGDAVMEVFVNGPSGPPAFVDERHLEFTESGTERVPVWREGLSIGEEPTETERLQTHCGELAFAPALSFEPSPAPEGTTTADLPTGMKLELKIPGTNPACTERTCPRSASQLKDFHLVLPEGLTLSAATAQGLQACSDQQLGLGTTAEATCPAASQIGTAEIYTPLLPTTDGKAPLTGRVYIGEPKCATVAEPEPCGPQQAQSGKLFRLFLAFTDPAAGVSLKLAGTTKANPTTGRLESVFEDQPQQPFERLVVNLKGGPRAPLAIGQACGGGQAAAAFTTTGKLTPWSAGGVEAVNAKPEWSPSTEFTVQCPTAFPFNPEFNAGTSHPAAGAYSSFSLTVSPREHAEDEQDLEGVAVQLAPGLTAKLAGVPLCPEAQANEGTCGAESQVGTATVLVGAGSHPLLKEGQVYLTGPTTVTPPGASAPVQGPYGLAIVVPTTAGPFTLAGQNAAGQSIPAPVTVVRSAIEIDKQTAGVTVVSNPIPQVLDGVPLRIRTLNVAIDRPGFTRNSTGCAAGSVTATLTSSQLQQASESSPFAVAGCHALSFKPRLTAETSGHTSRADGASLTVKIVQAEGEADLHRVDVQLPGSLPSDLNTLNKACRQAQFESNPAGCPEASRVGTATAHTPLLPDPLSGPAVLVSRGGQAFPQLVFLLEADGVHIDVFGNTQISKGITYSRFETVPDEPITSFETKLPEGSHALLSSNGNLCAQTLTMPTTIEGQNGASVAQQTHIAVVGCAFKTTAEKCHRRYPNNGKRQKACEDRAKLHKALVKCARSFKHAAKRRQACERRARKRYRASGRSARAATVLATAVPRPSGASPVLSEGLSATWRAAAAVIGAVSQSSPAAEEPAGDCPNEAERRDSNTNPTAGEPYSVGLGECRAYEMVSPTEKQGFAADSANGGGTLVAPSGSAVGWGTGGVVPGTPNYLLAGGGPRNSYLSVRGSSEHGLPAWLTQSTIAPEGVIDHPSIASLANSDYSPDLQSAHLVCGAPSQGGVACAHQQPGGTWVRTTDYLPISGRIDELLKTDPDEGQSGDLKHIFLLPGTALLPQDNLTGGGIYELSELSEGVSALRLVNVANRAHSSEREGTELGLRPDPYFQGGSSESPLLGDSSGYGAASEGTDIGAISESGETVFFTAEPAGTSTVTLYARKRCADEASDTCTFLEVGGHAVPGTGRETVQIFDAPLEPMRLLEFQGASADGSKVFFTAESTLYEAEPNATEITPRVIAGDVEGVVRIARTGEYVYYVTGGGKLHVSHGGATHLVAALSPSEGALWGLGCPRAEYVACDDHDRTAQTTPDGRDLVFASHVNIDGERDGCRGETVQGEVVVCEGAAVYRYDAETAEMTLISRDTQEPSEPDRGGSASIPAYRGATEGAFADIADVERVISGCPKPTSATEAAECVEGQHDGEYVLFTSEERLAPGDVDRGAPQVYLWHCAAPCTNPATQGVVSLISDGRGAAQIGGISASGRDAFFYTATQLVPGDSDEAADLYDARIDGGFLVASEPASCVAEACQGPLSAEPVFGPAGSSTLGAL